MHTHALTAHSNNAFQVLPIIWKYLWGVPSGFLQGKHWGGCKYMHQASICASQLTDVLPNKDKDVTKRKTKEETK